MAEVLLKRVPAKDAEGSPCVVLIYQEQKAEPLMGGSTAVFKGRRTLRLASTDERLRHIDAGSCETPDGEVITTIDPQALA